MQTMLVPIGCGKNTWNPYSLCPSFISRFYESSTPLDFNLDSKKRYTNDVNGNYTESKQLVNTQSGITPFRSIQLTK